MNEIYPDRLLSHVRTGPQLANDGSRLAGVDIRLGDDVFTDKAQN